MSIIVKQICAHEISQMQALMDVFAEAFQDRETYSGDRPDTDYLRGLLQSDYFIALAAFDDANIVGGLAAYELRKFEQRRSEIYIYDLAVLLPFRRKGIATRLIGKLGELAELRGAWVMFVQADTAEEDQPAIELYSKLGLREEVLHFDIPVKGKHYRS